MNRYPSRCRLALRSSRGRDSVSRPKSVSRRPRAAGPRLSMTAMPTRYLSLGLCSVTLRACSIDEVVAVAVGAGLECIEWGGDVHVPPGDLEAARRARSATSAAGLRVASYGSYWRCSGDF